MILERFGNRGYRAVQLEAGILSGKLYLGAYAQHVSATGLTFYDDEVIRFFSPHAHGKSVTMLVAVRKNPQSTLYGQVSLNPPVTQQIAQKGRLGKCVVTER